MRQLSGKKGPRFELLGICFSDLSNKVGIKVGIKRISSLL